MWHVNSRSGVATWRTAIHLLLTYLLSLSSVIRIVLLGIKGCVRNVSRAARRDVLRAVVDR